jgi:D-tyrosyl-tRNA(Tyr) deacylase
MRSGVRAVVQRVKEASVEVDGIVVGSIDIGLLVLVGAGPNDTEADAIAAANKISGLRIFSDADGKMNLGLSDVDGSMLVVSQFTLAGDVRKGRRPSFVNAARPEVAEPLVSAFCHAAVATGIRVEQGVFGADMKVSLVNDGPVTLIVDTRDGAVL